MHRAPNNFQPDFLSLPGDGECEPPLERRLEVAEDPAALLRVRQERRPGEPDGEERPPRQRVLRTLNGDIELGFHVEASKIEYK